MKRRILEVSESDQGATLEEFIASKLRLKQSEAAQLIEQGSVYLSGRRCHGPRRALKSADTVTVVLSERGRGSLDPSAGDPPPIPILFEDAALLAVNKPSGLDSQPSASREGDNLLDLLAVRLRRRPGVVHRLDRETSGVLVFGKTSQATGALSDQFRRGSVRKRYLAATGPGLAESGTIDLPISKDPTRIGRYRATHSANGVPSLTEFRRLFASDEYCLVALHPKTGRTHQLRAHLAALGAPILGDALYGGLRDLRGESIPRTLLHAHGLQLAHPLRFQPLYLEAPLPEDLAGFFERSGTAIPVGGI